MPFPERLRRTEIEKKQVCEICQNEDIHTDNLEIHSATSLHLVLADVNGKQKYLITSTHKGHENLRGKTISTAIYMPNGEPRESDAFCLCVDCHQEVHRIALERARKTDKNAKIAPPKILAEVTHFYIDVGRPILDKNDGFKARNGQETRKLIFSVSAFEEKEKQRKRNVRFKHSQK